MTLWRMVRIWHSLSGFWHKINSDKLNLHNYIMINVLSIYITSKTRTKPFYINSDPVYFVWPFDVRLNSSCNGTWF
jgi:hypothetical protein